MEVAMCVSILDAPAVEPSTPELPKLTKTQRRKRQRHRALKRKAQRRRAKTPEKLERKKIRQKIRKLALAVAKAARVRPHKPGDVNSASECPIDVWWPHEIRAAQLYRQAVELWDDGHHRAAGTMARSAIESKLREIARESPLVVTKPEAMLSRCVKTLMGAGVIDTATARALSRIANIGNQAAHGGDVTFDSLGDLMRTARTIVCLWPTDAAPMVPKRVAYVFATGGEVESFICV